MPDLNSRFGYVPYDDLASHEQNQLRDLCRGLEASFTAGSVAELPRLIFPINEYSPMLQANVDLILKTPMTPENLTLNLRRLEVIYYLLGKDIRLRCIKRLKAGEVAFASPVLPDWLEHWRRLRKSGS